GYAMARRPLSAVRCRRLAMQGFNDLDTGTLSNLAPWLRFTPALCGVGIAIGTLFAPVPLLAFMAFVALLGALLPWHPFDLLYTYGVRFLTRTPALPHNRAPRRLAMGSAHSAWSRPPWRLRRVRRSLATCLVG